MIDPRRLKRTELVRLLNSTPLGTVIDGAALGRHMERAGFRISAAHDHERIDLVRYLGWLLAERKSRRAAAVSEPPPSAPASPERWMTIAEVAAAFLPPVSNDAVRKWCKAGLPHVRSGPAGREMRIRAADLVTWAAGKRRLRLKPGVVGPEDAAGDGAQGGGGAAGEPDPREQEMRETSARIARARASLDEAKQRLAEVRLRKQLGQLVEAAEVEAVWAMALANFARGLDKVPELALGGLCRVVAEVLDELKVPAAKASAAVERLKPLMAHEIEEAVLVTRARLAADPLEKPDGQEGRGEEDQDDDD